MLIHGYGYGRARSARGERQERRAGVDRLAETVPVYAAWQAEELLHYIAGVESPAPVPVRERPRTAKHARRRGKRGGKPTGHGSIWLRCGVSRGGRGCFWASSANPGACRATSICSAAMEPCPPAFGRPLRRSAGVLAARRASANLRGTHNYPRRRTTDHRQQSPHVCLRPQRQGRLGERRCTTLRRSPPTEWPHPRNKTVTAGRDPVLFVELLANGQVAAHDLMDMKFRGSIKDPLFPRA